MWPSTADMQNAAHSAMQDMADHNYQGACYEAVNFQQNGGGSCLTYEFAHTSFCTWPDGGSCYVPACANPLGWTGTMCNRPWRDSDDQNGP